jgi:hypothetical protein
LVVRRSRDVGKVLQISGLAVFAPVRLGMRGLEITSRLVARAGGWAIRLNRAAGDNAEAAMSTETAEAEEAEFRLSQLENGLVA